MTSEEPPFLRIGTDVSAKFKGAFCEANIQAVKKLVKCKVAFKNGSFATVNNEAIVEGDLRLNSIVKVKQLDGEYEEGTVVKVNDHSLYTVVFDDGDERTLRRTNICLKGERHFQEDETLDNLPLTDPENFGTPVVKGNEKKRKRKNLSLNPDLDDDDSADDDLPLKYKQNPYVGKVVCVEIGERRKTWFPALGLRRDLAESGMTFGSGQILVQSFKDGKKICVNKTDVKDFSKEKEPLLNYIKGDTKIEPILRAAIEKALAYYDHGELPKGWNVELSDESSDEDDDSLKSEKEDIIEEREISKEEREKEKAFLAKLHKFMEKQGTPITKPPMLGNKDIDLYQLHKLVMENGGMEEVSENNMWRSIYGQLNIPILPTTASYNIRNLYKKFLFPLEENEREISQDSKQGRRKKLERNLSKDDSDSESEKSSTKAKEPGKKQTRGDKSPNLEKRSMKQEDKERNTSRKRKGEQDSEVEKEKDAENKHNPDETEADTEMRQTRSKENERKQNKGDSDSDSDKRLPKSKASERKNKNPEEKQTKVENESKSEKRNNSKGKDAEKVIDKGDSESESDKVETKKSDTKKKRTAGNGGSDAKKKKGAGETGCENKKKKNPGHGDTVSKKKRKNFGTSDLETKKKKQNSDDNETDTKVTKNSGDNGDTEKKKNAGGNDSDTMNKKRSNEDSDSEIKKKPVSGDSDSDNDKPLAKSAKIDRQQSRGDSDSESEKRTTRSVSKSRRMSTEMFDKRKTRTEGNLSECSDESLSDFKEMFPDEGSRQSELDDLVDVVNTGSPHSSVTSETDSRYFSDSRSEADVHFTEDGKYAIGARVLVRYGKGRNQRAYEAKVEYSVNFRKLEQVVGYDCEIEDEIYYYVHYTGWNMRYDEWIKTDRINGLAPKPPPRKRSHPNTPKNGKEKERELEKEKEKHKPKDGPSVKPRSDTSSTKSKQDAPNLQAKQETSVIKSKPESSSAKTKSDSSNAKLKSDTPNAKWKLETPNAKPKPETFNSKSKTESPSTKSKSETPHTKSKLTSSIKSKPETPNGKSKPETTKSKSETPNTKTKPEMVAAKSKHDVANPGSGSPSSSRQSTSKAAGRRSSPPPPPPPAPPPPEKITKPPFIPQLPEPVFHEIRPSPVKPRTTRNSMQDMFLITALEESISVKPSGNGKRKGSPLQDSAEESTDSSATPTCATKPKRGRGRPPNSPRNDSDSDFDKDSDGKGNEKHRRTKRGDSPLFVASLKQEQPRVKLEPLDDKRYGYKSPGHFGSSDSSKLLCSIKEEPKNEDKKDLEKTEEKKNGRGRPPGKSVKRKAPECEEGASDIKKEDKVNLDSETTWDTNESSSSKSSELKSESYNNSPSRPKSETTRTSNTDRVTDSVFQAPELVSLASVVNILERSNSRNAKDIEEALNEENLIKQKSVTRGGFSFLSPEKEREKKKRRRERRDKRRRKRSISGSVVENASESENSLQSPPRSERCKSPSFEPPTIDFVSDLETLAEMDATERIKVMQSRLTEMRKLYCRLKAEVASIDRRKRRKMRKQMEAAAMRNLEHHHHHHHQHHHHQQHNIESR